MMKRLLLIALLAFAPHAAEAANCNGYPFLLANNQTADATQVMANFTNILTCANANLAHNAANSDITSLNGLTIPLSAAQGGTGLASPTMNSVLLGNGLVPFQQIAPMTAGNLLLSNGTTWIASNAILSAVTTKALMVAGTDNTTIVTPVRVNDNLGVAKAWGEFSAGGTVLDAYNVSNTVSSGAGTTSVGFSIPFASGVFACQVTPYASGFTGSLTSIIAGAVTVQIADSATKAGAAIPFSLVCHGRQ